MNKKVQKWWSKKVQKGIRRHFRMSLSVQIFLNYLRFLVTNGILFFLILSFLYLQADLREYTQESDRMIVNMEMGEEQFLEYIKKNRPVDISVSLVRVGNDGGQAGQVEQVYSGTERNLEDYWYFSDYFHIGREPDGWKLFFRNEEEVYYRSNHYEAVFYYDLSGSLEKLFRFMRNAAIVYLLLILFLAVESGRDNRRVLQPIRDMTETIRKLSISNLHSERLLVKKTQNELKELAEVFNEMLDRLERSYESQKQFVSNASHELRTPIAVIQGYTGMLIRWGQSDEAILRESIEAISSESKAMQDLVEKLLFLSRHDKRTLKLKKEWFPVGEMLGEMVKETKMVVKERKMEAPRIDSVSIYGDMRSLKQAVRVLIDNAVKYSKDGDTITVMCEEAGHECRITVADTGIGMKQEELRHIFDRFYRSDDVRGRIEGHGLGLSIAKLIVTAHGGKIRVQSKYGEGTSFMIFLPKQGKR